MRIEYARDPDDFARRLASLPADVAGTVRVWEEARGPREWWLLAELHITATPRDHYLSVRVAVGHWLDNCCPAQAWPTHAVAIATVRDHVQTIRAGAADGGLRCVEALALTEAVMAERPAMNLIATAASRRLGAALAWCKREVV